MSVSSLVSGASSAAAARAEALLVTVLLEVLEDAPLPELLAPCTVGLGTEPLPLSCKAALLVIIFSSCFSLNLDKETRSFAALKKNPSLSRVLSSTCRAIG